MLWNWGTPRPLCLETGRENASVWEGGRRQRSSQRPGCNALDRVKVCQEREKERRNCPCSHRGHRRGLALDATVAPQGKGTVELKDISYSGKPDAVKAACPVWTGGKAERPYLSVQLRPGVRLSNPAQAGSQHASIVIAWGFQRRDRHVKTRHWRNGPENWGDRACS